MTRRMTAGLTSVVAASAMALVATTAPLAAQHKAPNAQPATAAADTSALPVGTTSLGTVRLTRSVKANGEALPAGSYQLRLTGEEPPAPTGATKPYERWVEFVRGGRVVGREVVSVVPASEIKNVSKGGAPAPGQSKVELLRGDDYLRVWVNRGGTHYLVHLATA
ncbi:MAG: hypothetical protein IT182_01495 [Acidobacteria bacterium]|nr:hypothetical protein [Acidobacteriota bacterium]